MALRIGLIRTRRRNPLLLWHKEVLMRILAMAMLAIGTVSIGPAAGQTYDPAHPVCPDGVCAERDRIIGFAGDNLKGRGNDCRL
jgi:hypothetical protein